MKFFLKKDLRAKFLEREKTEAFPKTLCKDHAEGCRNSTGITNCNTFVAHFELCKNDNPPNYSTFTQSNNLFSIYLHYSILLF